MTVVPANESHLNSIEQLLLAGRHVFTQPAFDLTVALQQHDCVVGVDGSQVWGFSSFENEPRPSTFAEEAPSRVYLSSVALANRRSPYDDVPRLIDALISTKTARWQQNEPQKKKYSLVQLIYYGHQHWLIKPLERAEFTVVERVESLMLDRLQRHNLEPLRNESIPPPYTMRLAQRADMASVADLDADAFTTLWHLGEEQLVALWAGDHRFYVACNGDEIIGYTATAQITDHNTRAGDERDRYVHLSRIATKSSYRGQGIGKALLLEVLDFAQQQGLQSVTLNTQTDNESSHALYRSVGFSKTGHIYPVLTKHVELAA